jgi:hypothetical protein
MLSRSRSLLAAVLVSVCTFSLVASAANWEGAGKGTFAIKAMAKPPVLKAFSFEGKGGPEAVEGKQDGDKLVFTASLGGLDMGERQEHTEKAFKPKSKEHGKATLTVDKAKLKLPADQKEIEGSVQGTFNYRGADETVTVSYTGSRTGSDFHVKSATFSFEYTKHNVEEICQFGGTICVQPKVFVTVKGVKFREKH